MLQVRGYRLGEKAMTIAAIIGPNRADIHCVKTCESVATAVACLAQNRIGALPVMDSDHVVGIFSERDVIYGLAIHGPAMLDKLVGDVMTSPAITATRDTPILSALSLMTKRRIRHLPVMNGEDLIGFVSIGDLVKHRIEKIETEASAMRDYIQMA
jgi:CBS domain-containing protein